MLEESEWEDADLAVEEDLGTSDRGLNTNTKQYIKKKNIETNIRIVVQEIDFYCHCHQTFGLSYLFDDEPLSCLSRCGAVMLRSQLVSIPRSWKY